MSFDGSSSPVPGLSLRSRSTTALVIALLLASGCGWEDIPAGQQLYGPDLHADSGEATEAGLDDVETGSSSTVCREGEARCWDDGRLATCLPGERGWLVESCEDGAFCQDGECVKQECRPGQLRCVGDAVQTCLSDLLTWSVPSPCLDGETCLRGVCIPRSCITGERLCGRDRVLICREDGLSWDEEVCPDGWVCFEGRCVACVRDLDCGPEQACSEGSCVARPLDIVTDSLPDGMVGVPYLAELEAARGAPPYLWFLNAGQLPEGLVLDVAGRIEGIPDLEGEIELVIGVEDSAFSVAEARLTLHIHARGSLVITTEELPEAEEGMEYRAQLEALGGTMPYAWMISDGELPQGLEMLAGGTIQGVPSEIGEFPLLVRVFDNSAHPGTAEAELVLRVRIAPLEIVGEQEYNLFLFKVIILPLITVVEGIPIPYRTQLMARGGLRPYHWSEEEIPALLRPLIPDAGIPDGLELAEDGMLSGAVVSTEQVISLDIPFTDINLNGFFFMARVEDSQEEPESQTAVFLVPTLPIGGP